MSKNRKFKINYKDYAVFIFFLVVFLFFSLFGKGFFVFRNIMNVLRQISIYGILSVGAMMVILTGGIDLSVGSIIGTCGTFAAFLIAKSSWDILPASLLTITLGATIGLFNGFLITKANIPPLIATLATQTGFRGVAYVITKGVPIYGFPDAFTKIGQGYIWVIPIPVIIMVIIMIIGQVILSKTTFGMHIYGIGGNNEAARLCGVNVKKKLNIVYLISGFLAGFAGLVLLARINTGTATLGDGYEMSAISAVVLGGVSITGGEGKLRNVIVGVLIMGILNNGLLIMGISEYYQWIVRCVVLLLAVGFDRNVNSVTRKSRQQKLPA